MKFIWVSILIILVYVTNININKETIKTTTESFATNIELDYKIFNIQGGKRNVFVPMLLNKEHENIQKYKEIFNLKGYVEENDIYYKIKDDETENYICVYKNLASFKYVQTNNKILMTDINEDEAIKKANEFLKQHSFNLRYSDINVKTFDSHFDIYYIDILDNMKNYSFLNCVRLDKKGNIIYFKYYDVDYKKLGEIEIINEKMAYNHLLNEYTSAYGTSISGCELVYLYKDNVCIPHFAFSGSNENGEIVEIFINAKKQ